jgi:hypothetical protein
MMLSYSHVRDLRFAFHGNSSHGNSIFKATAAFHGSSSISWQQQPWQQHVHCNSSISWQQH